ncbi:hypothetical protein [Aquimarina macrocephali]|uniref:hypothetical protein n=1 Tax=Aquimarina macrocephali TaxID=666563 RepID=UPI003F668083
MKKLILLFFCFSFISYGQIENRWQPDSVYANHKVKKIYVYLNSPKDLSEIVEFEQTGKRLCSIKYSSSYNRRTRKSKRIEKISHYKYDSSDRLIKIIDSVGTDSITFQYGTNGKLFSSRKNLGSFIYDTKYSYEPFKSTTTLKNDSIVFYEKAKEYELDFYVSRFFGYYMESKLKKAQTTENGITNTYAYSDQTDLQRFEDNKTIKNSFDTKGRLIKSEIKSVFMNDRVNEYELNYKYYKNGLIESIRGYIPRYFKYEFWE